MRITEDLVGVYVNSDSLERVSTRVKMTYALSLQYALEKNSIKIKLLETRQTEEHSLLYSIGEKLFLLTLNFLV